MATNYVQPGEKMEWTNGTGADVVSSQLVVAGSLLAVAEVDIANLATGTVCTEGVFSVPKVAAAVIAQGDPVAYIAATANIGAVPGVPAPGDVTGAATAWKAAGNGATTVHIKLNTGGGTVA